MKTIISLAATVAIVAGTTASTPVPTPSRRCVDVVAESTDGYGPSTFVYATVPGDYNGDGDQDLADCGIAGQFDILIGDGHANFTGPTAYTTTYSTFWDARSYDLNGDGADELIGCSNSGLEILYTDGAGGFTGLSTFPTSTGTGGFDLGDINNDGYPDAMLARESSDGVSILFGTAGGGFTAETFIANPYHPSDVELADFDGDGNLDAAVTRDQDNLVEIWFGDGTGGFTLANTLATGSFPISLLSDDFNLDGHADLVIRSFTETSMPIYFGDGTGLFTASSVPSANSNAFTNCAALASGDLNDDGAPDLISVGGAFLASGTHVSLGDATGSFTTTNFYGGTYATASGTSMAAFDNQRPLEIATSLTFDATGSIIVIHGDCVSGGNPNTVRFDPPSTPAIRAAGRFTQAFAAKQSATDLNKDGVVDLSDLTDYIRSMPAPSGPVGVAPRAMIRD